MDNENCLFKRKSKRRSSMTTSQVLNLVRNEQMSEKEVLGAVAEVQYNWIQSRMEELKYQEKISHKKATGTAGVLNSVDQKLDDEYYQKFSNLSMEEQFEKLTEKQRFFLSQHQLHEEFIMNHLKKMKRYQIQMEMDQINKNESISYLKKSYLNKKLSRSSFGNSQSTSRSSFDGINSRDYLSPEEILVDYFAS